MMTTANTKMPNHSPKKIRNMFEVLQASAVNSWKNTQTLRYKKYMGVSDRTNELLNKACAEGKEITPELEQKILEQVYKEFGI